MHHAKKGHNEEGCLAMFLIVTGPANQSFSGGNFEDTDRKRGRRYSLEKLKRLLARDRVLKEIHTGRTCTSRKGFHLGAERLRH